jgi:ribulose bisphosphate carboxylase small subunit
LRGAWSSLKDQPYDFLVQSPTWKLGAVSIAILRKQFDKTYVAVAFDNNGRAVTLNFIVVNGPDGWVISDIESPHDSLRMFLAQYKN